MSFTFRAFLINSQIYKSLMHLKLWWFIKWLYQSYFRKNISAQAFTFSTFQPKSQWPHLMGQTGEQLEQLWVHSWPLWWAVAGHLRIGYWNRSVPLGRTNDVNCTIMTPQAGTFGKSPVSRGNKDDTMIDSVLLFLLSPNPTLFWTFVELRRIKRLTMT